MADTEVEGSGTPENPWILFTPPGKSEFEAYRDPAADPPALVVQVGKTQLRYQLRCLDDLHAMLVKAGDWVPLGSADEQKPAVDGTVVFTNFTPFEEASKNRETALYLSWLQQVKPGADPGFFGVFAWSAARLFVELATKLGGNLSRATLLEGIKKTDNWTSEGLHAPQRIGPKQTGECWRYIELKGGTWRPLNGTKYSCTGLTVG